MFYRRTMVLCCPLVLVVEVLLPQVNRVALFILIKSSDEGKTSVTVRIVPSICARQCSCLDVCACVAGVWFLGCPHFDKPSINCRHTESTPNQTSSYAAAAVPVPARPAVDPFAVTTAGTRRSSVSPAASTSSAAAPRVKKEHGAAGSDPFAASPVVPAASAAASASAPAQRKRKRSSSSSVPASANDTIDLTSSPPPAAKRSKIGSGSGSAKSLSAPSAGTDTAPTASVSVVKVEKRSAAELLAAARGLLEQFPRFGAQWHAAIRGDGFDWNSNGPWKRAKRSGAITSPTLCAHPGCSARKLMRLSYTGWVEQKRTNDHVDQHPPPEQQRAPILHVDPAAKQDAVTKFVHGQTTQQVHEDGMVEAMKSADPAAALSKLPTPGQLKHLKSKVSKAAQLSEQDIVAISRQYGPGGLKALLYCAFISTAVVESRPQSSFNPCMVFATPDSLQRLVDNERGIVYVDGTFDVMPMGLQVVTVSINHRGYGVAVAFLVSSGRDTETYIAMLIQLLLASNRQWQPRAVICDFELALQNSFLQVFPTVQIWGCLFHYQQAIRKWCVENPADLPLKAAEIEERSKRIFLAPTMELHDEEVAKFMSLAGRSPFWAYYTRTFLEYVNRSHSAIACTRASDAAVLSLHSMFAAVPNDGRSPLPCVIPAAPQSDAISLPIICPRASTTG
jgi:hypothetical protein